MVVDDYAWRKEQEHYRDLADQFAEEIRTLPIEKRTDLWHIFWCLSPGRAIRDGRALVELAAGNGEPLKRIAEGA